MKKTLSSTNSNSSPKSTDNSLCLCEYVNDEGERSHLLATFCNCEAIDEACDRIISRTSMDSELKNNVCNAIEDRFRIPWLNGAKKISPYLVIPYILLPAVVFIGSINFTCTLISYLVIVPTLFLVCNKILKSRMLFYRKVRSNFESFFRIASVYFHCYVVSLLLIFYIIFHLVFTTMEICRSEFFLFVLLFTSSWTCFYVVRTKGKRDLERTKLLDVSLFTKNNEAKYCYYCDTFILLKDHHCLWLQTCISNGNKKWFLSGIFLLLIYLIYCSYLIFTTVCHIRKAQIGLIYIFVPVECIDAYSILKYSLPTSVGCYTILLALFVGFVWLHMCYKISIGRENKNSLMNRKFIFIILHRWHKFWFL